MPDAPAAPIPAGAPETQPLVDALNRLVDGIDKKNAETLASQNKLFADALNRQTEALSGLLGRTVAAIPTSPAVQPVPAPLPTAEVNVGPIIIRILKDAAFRDKVVALHNSFPGGG